jgi:CRP-like cAMP-binding protein
MVSLIYASENGGVDEMATVGREGAVGFIGGLSIRRMFNRCIVQVPGEADRITTSRLRTAFAENEAVRDLIMRYIEARHAQVLQSVACNALHPVEARCCRWLLLTRDRTGSNILPLTQEFLAEMLGVQRPTVALALKTLEAAAVIRRRRCQIEIVDGAGLEELSCECYRLVHDYYEQALGPWNP